jgi:hypothetical protein
VSKEVYASGLEAMVSLGVRVYIMGPEQFGDFKSLKRDGRYKDAYDMLQELQPLGSNDA